MSMTKFMFALAIIIFSVASIACDDEHEAIECMKATQIAEIGVSEGWNPKLLALYKSYLRECQGGLNG